jgi:hypothetical protein
MEMKRSVSQIKIQLSLYSSLDQMGLDCTIRACR